MELRISEKAKSISPSPTLAIDSKFKQMKQQGIPVVGFGAGEPDFDTPDNIKEAGITAIQENFTRYTPASGTIDLKRAICCKVKADTGLEYFLFSQSYRKGVQNYFGKGVRLDQARNFAKSNRL